MNLTPIVQINALLARRWLRISFGIFATVVVAFGLLGYFWLPGFAKAKLETTLSVQLHRPVTVQEIAVSPYALTLTVRGFSIGELPQRVSDKSVPVLAFDELYLNLSIMSLIRRVPVISEVHLRGPRVHLERDMDGRYSISDLLDEWMSKPASPNDDKSPAQFSVANIQIDGGHIDFIDHPKGSQQEISELKLGIPFLANFVSSDPIWVEPHFSAKFNGALIALEGKVLPFAERRVATLALKFTDFDLTRIDEYAPIPVKVKLAALKLDSDLQIGFAQAANAASEITLAGKLRLHDLDLQEAAHGRSLLTLKALEVQLGALDLAKRVVKIDKILLQGLDADVLRGKNGQLEISGLLASATAPKKTAAPVAPTAPAAPENATTATKWSVGAGDTLLENIRLRYTDTSAPTPFIATIEKADAALHNFELNSEAPFLAELHLNEISVRRLADKQPLLRIAEVNGADISAILPKREISVGSINFKSAQISIIRESDGGLDFQRLMAPPSNSAPNSATAPSSASSAWKSRVTEFAIADAAITFVDKTLANPLPLKVAALDFKLANFDSSSSTAARADLQATVNKRGKIQVGGAIGMSPFASDMAIVLKDIDLIPLQGWAGDRLNALVTRGDLSFKGRVKAEGTPISVAVKGDARLTNFNLLDRENAADLLSWRSFDVGGINVTTAPLKVDVTTVSLSDFFAKIILSSAGRLNLKDILKHDAATDIAKPDTTPAAAPVTTQTNAASVESSAPLPVRIGKITLQGGRVDFTDNFIKPNYSANLSALGGRVGPLQSGTMGDVEIRGTVNTSAPLEILGKVDPFAQVLSLDIAAKAKGIDLPNFSPYSGKYVGYVIDKGKLSVDVRYRVANGELTAQNSIFIDQLTFGKRVESPDALSIPVTLAVALLKNSRGEIDLQLPVTGSLNDPKFSVGSLIWQVLGNLIVKAVTSPFALLGSLFGDGEELSQLDFVAGRARLEPEAEKRLQSLAKALTDRNGLKLEITGRADPVNDREGLKRAVLDRKVKAQKLAEIVKRGEAAGALGEVAMSNDEYPKYLELAYKEDKFPKPKNLIGLNKSLPVAEMEQLMLTHIEAGTEEMKELAQRRAQAAHAWIVGKGGIASERVFVLAPKVEPEADGKKLGSRVEFSLK